MPSKSSKKSPAKSAKSTSSSVIPFAQLGNSASTPSFESMEKIMSTSKKQYETFSADASAASRQGVEAFIKSGTTFAKGAEQIFKTFAAIAQESAERNSVAIKDLLSCKTLNELTETQNRIAQDNFDDVMTASTKISEMAIKLATEVFEPINDQVSKSIKKASESLAA